MSHIAKLRESLTKLIAVSRIPVAVIVAHVWVIVAVSIKPIPVILPRAVIKLAIRLLFVKDLLKLTRGVSRVLLRGETSKSIIIGTR